MTAPAVRRVTATFSATGRGVIYDGKVYATPAEVAAVVKRQDRRRGGFAVTVLAWENCPDGFTGA